MLNRPVVIDNTALIFPVQQACIEQTMVSDQEQTQNLNIVAADKVDSVKPDSAEPTTTTQLHQVGYTEGRLYGVAQGRSEGYKAGYEAGHDTGYEEGHKAGYDDAAKTGYDEGHQTGYDAGHKLGYEAGAKEGEQTVKEMMSASIHGAAQEAAAIVAAANQQTKKAVLAAEKQIVELAIAIAEKVVATTVDPEVVIAVVKQALERVRNQEHVKLRLNSVDFATIIAIKADLEALLQREQAIEFVVDQTVEKGGCVIDFALGTVDARRETRLQAVVTAVRSALS